jgi:hypothetical protein
VFAETDDMNSIVIDDMHSPQSITSFVVRNTIVMNGKHILCVTESIMDFHVSQSDNCLKARKSSIASHFPSFSDILTHEEMFTENAYHYRHYPCIEIIFEQVRDISRH